MQTSSTAHGAAAKPSLSLKGRVALVTGGSSGIGKACAIAMAQEGAKVALLSFEAAKNQAAAKEIEAQGAEVLPIEADISKPEDMQRAYRQIKDRWDRLDIVFANAGINGVWAPLDELKVEEWRHTLDVNLTGTFLTVKYALPLLRKQGGSIIITSSVNGTRMFSNSGASAYASTKAAEVAFAKMIALELAPDHIRVNAICPGAIQSDIQERTTDRDLQKIEAPVKFPEGVIPLTGGKVPPPDVVAPLVVFLASDASRHITGTEVFVDGAESLLQG